MPLVIFLLSLSPLVQTAQLIAPYPYGGLVPEHLLFNIRTTGAAGEYNEKPLTTIGIFAATSVNPTNPTTPVRPGRKYKRVVCPPGFTRAGDIIPGLDSPVPTAIHDIPEPISNGPSVEHVTVTDIGGGSTPNIEGSPSTPIAQLFPPLAPQSAPTANPSAPGASPQTGAYNVASIPSVEHVTGTTIGGDHPSVASIPSASPLVSPPASPASPPVSFVVSPVNPAGDQHGVAPASSFPVFPSSTPSIITPSSAPSGGKFFDATVFLPSQDASSPPITTDPSVTVTPPIRGVAEASSFPVFPTTTPSIIVPPSHLEPALSDNPSDPSIGADSVGPASPSIIIPSSAPSGGKFYDEPSFQLSQAASSSPITTDPTITVTTPITTPTTDIPNDVPNQNTITPLPPTTTVTTTTTSNDPPSAAQVITSTTSPDSPTETTSPNHPSDLQVTESLPPTTSVPAPTVDPSHPPSPPQFFVRQAITDPDACIPIPDDNPTGGVPFLGSALQPPAIPPTPITTQITFTTSEFGTLVTGVTVVTTIPGVHEIQPVPITTQVTLTTSISGTLQTVVTLVTTTPPPIPIEPPQLTTALITFTTSESGTLVTVVTLVTRSLTNPTTESITYVTLISGTPQTMVTVLTEEAFAGFAIGTTIPFSEITILLDWPAPTTTTTSQSGFGGSFSTYREGITFWIVIMCGLFIMGVWF